MWDSRSPRRPRPHAPFYPALHALKRHLGVQVRRQLTLSCLYLILRVPPFLSARLVSLSPPTPVFFDAVRTILVRRYIFGDNWTLIAHHVFATHRTVAAQRPRMIALFTHQARFILAIGLLLGQVIRVSSQGTVAASDLPSCADSCASTASIAAGCTL